MIEPMHLYPEEKKRMQEVEKQGLSVMTCNNWLCPFNNDGYCVEPTKGDTCGIYGDEEFEKYLSQVYDESRSDEFREYYRQCMIVLCGKDAFYYHCPRASRKSVILKDFDFCSKAERKEDGK
jgi:hypothetical protein